MKRENHLAHFLNGDLSEPELAQMKESGDYDLYRRIAAYTEDLETPLSEKPEMLQAVLSSQKKPGTVRTLPQIPAWLSAAACVIVLLGLGYWMTFGKTTEFRTAYAQYQNISLPDGSRVTLNTDGVLNFKPFDWHDNRKLNLEGEAWFKVARGKKFDVRTPTGTVSVLGTQFNVKSREGKLLVTCYEGKVLVSHHDQQQILTKGQAVSVANGVWTRFGSVDQEPEWMHRKMAFRAATLAEMMAELQRTYNIRIDSKANPETTFTGTLPSDDLDTALKIVESAFALKRTETSKNQYHLKPE